MTDHESENSPEHEEVRRLLADARHDDPVPPAVVARLERVLADLGAGPAPSPTVRAVTSLATRRRRVGQLLVAAAAVVVVGIGVGEVLDSGVGSDDGAGESADAGAEPEPVASEAGPQAVDEAAPEAAPQPQDGVRRDPQVWGLSASSFAEDARELSEAYSASAAVAGTADRTDALQTACLARDWGRGSFVPVTYDGTPGVLVFRRPRGDTQVADLFVCGSTDPLRSVSLPAP